MRRKLILYIIFSFYTVVTQRATVYAMPIYKEVSEGISTYYVSNDYEKLLVFNYVKEKWSTLSMLYIRIV